MFVGIKFSCWLNVRSLINKRRQISERRCLIPGKSWRDSPTKCLRVLFLLWRIKFHQYHIAIANTFLTILTKTIGFCKINLFWHWLCMSPTFFQFYKTNHILHNLIIKVLRQLALQWIDHAICHSPTRWVFLFFLKFL